MSLQLLSMFHQTELLPGRYKRRKFTAQLTVLRSVRLVGLPEEDATVTSHHLNISFLDFWT